MLNEFRRQLGRAQALAILTAAAIGLAGQTQFASASARPLEVALIPADGGTADGTLADFQPIFAAITKGTGLDFRLNVGQSYNAVVEAMCNRTADIAFFGPVSYVQARRRGCAELLAVAVENRKSTYYAGIFAMAHSPIASIKDLKGRRAAFGDVNSASAFVFPIAMILEAGLDPVRDLQAIRLTGSHNNSLSALLRGQVDVACLSFESFDKATAQGIATPGQVKVVARSIAIPNPPIAMSTGLAPELKAKLKDAFASVSTMPGVTPDTIRGYGGRKVDGYDASFPESEFAIAGAMMESINDELRGEILRKAATP